jgi:repressor LexA
VKRREQTRISPPSELRGSIDRRGGMNYVGFMAPRAKSISQILDGCVPVELSALELETNSRCFALRVRGQAMREAHIVDGDIVLMEFRPPYDGSIVAALIDGECVLRRYAVEGGVPCLRTAAGTDEVPVPAEDLVIQGVLRAVVRHVTNVP